jgi:DNA-binding transcriptional regulator GbsR (MarR family)
MSEDDEAVTAARNEVIEAFERSAELYGVNRSYGRLYGILYFATEPLSLDGLVERSGYAKSTVSTTLKKLDRLHFVHRRSVPGEGRKVFYEAERDFWRIGQDLLRDEVLREIAIMTRALSSAAETLEDVEGERAETDLERIRSLLRIYRRSERIVEALTGASAERLHDLFARLTRD